MEGTFRTIPPEIGAMIWKLVLADRWPENDDGGFNAFVLRDPNSLSSNWLIQRPLRHWHS